MNDEKSFIFCDPSYLIDSKLYGNHGDLHKGFDHESLYKWLSKIDKGNWILTYNDCNYIRKFYIKIIK